MVDGLKYLQYSQDGPVATILLDNPPLNLLCQPLKVELMGLLDGIAEDGSIRVVILAGAGEKAFAAGADMKEFIARVENRTARADSQRGQLLCKKLYHLPQPVIAGIHGFCFGGGMVNNVAVRVPELGAGVPFYGSAPMSADVPKIKAAMLFNFADMDDRINGMWPAYETALKAAGVKYQMFKYPGTQHGFHNDTTPRYDEAAAKLAWQRTMDHFNKTLKT
jgi:dienelactone hydrolase